MFNLPILNHTIRNTNFRNSIQSVYQHIEIGGYKNKKENPNYQLNMP